MVLGDMGADVIKLENADKGDTSRQFEPQVNGESYCFAVLNRNKQSIALNLKDPAGLKIAQQLAAKADIVLENFRPGVVKRMGLDYDSICAHNPGVIYASMSGFGQTGPYGQKGGYDIIAQGMSGIMMMTGEPGGRPAKVGIAMNDIASGVTALSGILGALIGLDPLGIRGIFWLGRNPHRHRHTAQTLCTLPSLSHTRWVCDRGGWHAQNVDGFL
jgi:formyl-CoA transferase